MTCTLPLCESFWREFIVLYCALMSYSAHLKPDMYNERGEKWRRIHMNLGPIPFNRATLWPPIFKADALTIELRSVVVCL